MIEIYNKKELLPPGRKLIVNNETVFPGLVNIREFTEDDYAVIKLIDNAELIDENTGSIQTPFGITEIGELSSGCKTVLNYLGITRHLDYWENPPMLDISECGANALDVLFDIVEKHPSGVLFFLRHTDKLFKCKTREFLFNGKMKGDELNDIRLCN